MKQTHTTITFLCGNKMANIITVCLLSFFDTCEFRCHYFLCEHHLFSFLHTLKSRNMRSLELTPGVNKPTIIAQKQHSPFSYLHWIYANVMVFNKRCKYHCLSKNGMFKLNSIFIQIIKSILKLSRQFCCLDILEIKNLMLIQSFRIYY